jgi:hypothetical protein
LVQDGYYKASNIDLHSLDYNATYYFVTLSYVSEGTYASLMHIEQRDTYFLRNVVGDYFRNGGH